MSSYVNKWFEIINKMSNTNTYKLAWGRAIVEHISRINDFSQPKILIHFDDISFNIIKYYWNQTFFFDLKQSSSRAEQPLIYQKITQLIEEYQTRYRNIPEWFDKAILKFPKEKCDRLVKDVSNILKKDVSWRFPFVEGNKISIYDLDLDDKTILIESVSAKEIQVFSEVLIQLLNYKWAQLLEQYNTAPRIASKVKGLSDSKIKRKSLSNYKDILLKLHNNEVLDFYTNEPIEQTDISIDHFIPWSYIYSDDIWNLVITSKKNNSAKSNRIPNKDYIEKLEERNRQLLGVLEDEKLKNELIISLEHHYVTSFYMNLIG